MIVKNNVPIYQISWLNYANGGMIGTFYEPENREELLVICTQLYKEGKAFDVIGCTSNIYYLPSYNVDIMVSTRKVKNLIIDDNYIIADCGVSVRLLARQMVKEGIRGFEGLIDLPGTIAASVYGNAACYDCSINKLLISFDLLKPDGHIYKLTKNSLNLSNRSSSLKRGEMEGVILSVKLKKDKGDPVVLQTIADSNQRLRKLKQPPMQNNLGSIYYGSFEKSLLGKFIDLIVCVHSFLYRLLGYNITPTNKLAFALTILGQKKLIPYMYSWNRFIWKDCESHVLFWEYHRLHQKVFKHSNFEIEIKGSRQ